VCNKEGLSCGWIHRWISTKLYPELWADICVEMNVRRYHPEHSYKGIRTNRLRLIIAGLYEHILHLGFLDRYVLQSDHSGMFVDLRIESMFGWNPDKLAPHQFHNLKLDDPRISDKYRNILHKQF
jgi:hypothetical protein